MKMCMMGMGKKMECSNEKCIIGCKEIQILKTDKRPVALFRCYWNAYANYIFYFNFFNFLILDLYATFLHVAMAALLLRNLSHWESP